MPNDFEKAKAGFEQLKKTSPVVKHVVDRSPSKPVVGPPSPPPSPPSTKSGDGGGGPPKPVKSDPYERFEQEIESKPVVKEIVKASERPPSPDVYIGDVGLKPEQSITITYEKPGGEIGTVATKVSRFDVLHGEMQEKKWRVIQIQTGADETVFRTETTGGYQKRVVDYYRSSYEKQGWIPYSIRKQIKKDMPSDIVEWGMGEKYTRIVYMKSLGLSTKELESGFEKEYQQKWIKEKGLEWVKSQKYDDPFTSDVVESLSWEELKKRHPALYIKQKSSGEYYIDYDVIRWQQEQDIAHEGDIGYHVGKFFSGVFSPERYTMTYEQLFGRGKDVLPYTTKGGMVDISGWHGRGEELMAISQYEYTKAWSRGDIPVLAGRFVTSPLVMPVVTSMVFKGVSLAAHGIKSGVKAGVRYIPQVVKKIKTDYPRFLPRKMITESGKLVTTKRSMFINQLGRTQFYQNISGWASDTLIRVKPLPLKRFIRTSVDDDLVKETYTYKTSFKDWITGKTKPEWIRKELVKRPGFTGEAGVYPFEATRPGIISKARYYYIHKPRGRLWWKKADVEVFQYEKFSPIKMERIYTAKGAEGSWIRPGVISEKAIQKITGDTGHFIKPDIDPNLIIASKDALNIKSKFWLDTRASSTLVKPQRTVIVGPHAGMTTGYIGSTRMIPLAASEYGISVSPVVKTGIISASHLGVIGIQEPDIDFVFKQKSIQKPSLKIERMIRLDSDRLLDWDQINLLGLRTGQMQKQIQSQKLALQQVQQYDLVSIPVQIPPSSPPSYPVPTPKIKLRFFLLDEGVSGSKLFKDFEGFWSRGYRFRKWKTPRLSDILGGI